MKLYKNAIAEMKVKGCLDCPNRVARRIAVRGGFYTDYACAAIMEKVRNPIMGTEEVQQRYPSVREPMQHGGCLWICPLPEVVEEGVNNE